MVLAEGIGVEVVLAELGGLPDGVKGYDATMEEPMTLSEGEGAVPVTEMAEAEGSLEEEGFGYGPCVG